MWGRVERRGERKIIKERYISLFIQAPFMRWRSACLSLTLFLLLSFFLFPLNSFTPHGWVAGCLGEEHSGGRTDARCVLSMIARIHESHLTSREGDARSEG